MLDAATKRRIDSCRDILVGKVPDPKSQVEQITIALIYKFMDDMDAQAEELGGKRSFFVNGFGKYSWAKLLAPSMGGQDTLNLYSEAIGKMTENTHLPALFRDIFKNAYLPYRDPETLRSFLKEIDTFNYDHSERLGDAFEYLLSVLGSQGNAGQFRTPRHIIDFIVEVVKPLKHDRILDPACGTAGFLISAWKHILSNNKKDRPGDLLTPDERNKLSTNIRGYDISPDMVRLSLVNLYLHGFTNPQIDEYDTLTSEERWNEYADVILANPPFMSPKGGIKPHKRFSIQATRSEVLFVDYMAEHLSPNGRAGIIVPEGIIFQRGTAYKTLREMLVKKSLVAVVSLPAGVFNPYSGVKTSILILDKRLAKQTDRVLFVKVENDGFGLGSQRRAHAKDDLPEALSRLEDFFSNPTDFQNGMLAHSVERSEIAKNVDWSLSGDIYVPSDFQLTHCDMVTLQEVCQINPKKSELSNEASQTLVSFVPMQDLSENNIDFQPHQTKTLAEAMSGSYTYFRDGDVLLAKVTPCFENGKAGLAKNLVNNVGFGSSEYYVLRGSDKILPELLYYYVTSDQFRNEVKPKMTGTGGLQRVPRAVVENFKIPLPTIDAQHKILSVINGYKNVIDGARQVLDNYKPHIAVKPEWPLVSLGELYKTKSGTTPRRENPEYFVGGTIPWVKTLDLNNDAIHVTDEKITELAIKETHLEILPKGTVLVAMYGGFNQIGRTGVLEIEAAHNQAMTALLPVKNIDPYYLNTILIASRSHWKSVANSTRKDPNITKSDVLNFKLPLPDLETQKGIVNEIKVEQSLVASNKDLILRFERKIKMVIDEIWGG